MTVLKQVIQVVTESAGEIHEMVCLPARVAPHGRAAQRRSDDCRERVIGVV